VVDGFFLRFSWTVRKIHILRPHFLMGPLSISLKDKRKWSICVITIQWGIKSTRKQSEPTAICRQKFPTSNMDTFTVWLWSTYSQITVNSQSNHGPLKVRLRSALLDHGQLTVRSRSTHTPITVHSQSDHGQFTVRSWSTQSRIAVSSQSDHGQLPVRSRSAHSAHTSVRNCTVPWKWSPVRTLL